MIDAISGQGDIPVGRASPKLNTGQANVSQVSERTASDTVSTAPSSQSSSTTAVDFERLREAVEAAVAKIVNAVEASRTTVTFSVHDETHVVVIRVADANTGELIREFPPEEVLDSAYILQNMGFFVDESA